MMEINNIGRIVSLCSKTPLGMYLWVSFFVFSSMKDINTYSGRMRYIYQKWN